MGKGIGGGGSSRKIPRTWEITAAVQLHVYAGQAYAVTESAASAQRWQQQQQQHQKQQEQ